MSKIYDNGLALSSFDSPELLIVLSAPRMLKGSEQVKRYSPSHELYLLYDYLVGSGSGFMEIFGDVAK